MVMRARFSRTHCQACALKPRCTRSARRLLTLRPREDHAALEVARVRETQEAYAAQYRARAGIEGTLSQAVRTMHLRRARYIGLAKVHPACAHRSRPQPCPCRGLAGRHPARAHAPVSLRPAHGTPSLNPPNSPAASQRSYEAEDGSAR